VWRSCITDEEPVALPQIRMIIHILSVVLLPLRITKETSLVTPSPRNEVPRMTSYAFPSGCYASFFSVLLPDVVAVICIKTRNVGRVTSPHT
jgi:hypothetical protein